MMTIMEKQNDYYPQQPMPTEPGAPGEDPHSHGEMMPLDLRDLTWNLLALCVCHHLTKIFHS